MTYKSFVSVCSPLSRLLDKSFDWYIDILLDRTLSQLTPLRFKLYTFPSNKKCEIVTSMNLHYIASCLVSSVSIRPIKFNENLDKIKSQAL
jgi:hypothetical protein